MRGSLLGSALIHLVLGGALFLVRPSAVTVVPGPEVVQVALVDPSMLAVTEPAPAPAAVKPVRPEPTPDEPEGVRIEKPKPAPKKPPEPTRQPPSDRPKPPQPVPTSSAMTTLPPGPMAGAGLRGQVSVDAKDFEFTYYLVLVRNAIARNWSPPAAGQGTRATVYFRIARDGSVRGVSIEQGSGVDFFDQSASRAVLVSDPLPPLPLGWSGAELGVHFGFEYTGP